MGNNLREHQPQNTDRAVRMIRAVWKRMSFCKQPKTRWHDIDLQIRLRNRAIKIAVRGLSESRLKTGLPAKALLRLAAADVFVEKAQERLTARARIPMFSGCICAAAALSRLLIAAVLVHKTKVDDLIGAGDLTGMRVTVILIRAISFGGFLGGATYFLGALANSLFHEGTALLSRRHALRLGRLAIYLRSGDLTIDEIERIFHWNDEFRTAFERIDAKSIRGPGLSSMTPEAGNAIAAIIRAARGLAPDSNGSTVVGGDPTVSRRGEGESRRKH